MECGGPTPQLRRFEIHTECIDGKMFVELIVPFTLFIYWNVIDSIIVQHDFLAQ